MGKEELNCVGLLLLQVLKFSVTHHQGQPGSHCRTAVRPGTARHTAPPNAVRFNGTQRNEAFYISLAAHKMKDATHMT